MEDEDYIGATALKASNVQEEGEYKMKVVFSTLKSNPSDDPNLEEHVKAEKNASPRGRWPSLLEEGAIGEETKNERRNGSGGRGKCQLV